MVEYIVVGIALLIDISIGFLIALAIAAFAVGIITIYSLITGNIKFVRWMFLSFDNIELRRVRKGGRNA